MKKANFKIGDTRLVEGQEYICKGITSSGKPIWRKNGEKQEEAIQKGYNVGDEKDFNGRTYYCAELNAKGQPKWRLKDKKGGAKSDTAPAKQGGTQQTAATQQGGGGSAPKQDDTASQKKVEDMTPDELIDYAKKASTEALAKMVNDSKADKQLRQLAFNELKTRKDYEPDKVSSQDLVGGYFPKRKATIQYKTKKPEVEIEEFKPFEISTKAGRKTVTASGQRRLMAGYDDDKLLSVLNNHDNRWQSRQIAYEEAAARGIPEDKIDVAGTLQREWKRQKTNHDIREANNKEVDEDEALALNYDWKGLDHEKIMHEVFDDGNDTTWLDPNAEIVKKTFHTETLAGRQKYDTFKDYYQRDPNLVPGYLNASNKVNNLNGQMWEWAQSDDSPLFISAGGAGAGKTYGWRYIVAEDLSLPELKAGDDPTNTDWGWVMLTDQAASDDRKFSETLAKYNGTFIGDDGEEHPHILFFDDADKILVSKSKPMMALMKKINDPDPQNRVFHNPTTGQDEIWRGKIIITTNKELAKVANDEDGTAILSRATTSEIQFTRNETMELLQDHDRYRRMSLPKCKHVFKRDGFTEDDIKEFREEVFEYMQEHLQEADPRKFTPRTFEQLCAYIAPMWKNGSSARKTGNGVIGTDVDWHISAMSLLKAENNDIEKGYDDMYSSEVMVAQKKHLEKLMAEAKKKGKFEKLFGQKAQDAILFGDSTEDEKDEETGDKKKSKKSKKSEKKKDEKAEKAFNDDMTLEEAEDILFS